jgi:hypothetical protein
MEQASSRLVYFAAAQQKLSAHSFTLPAVVLNPFGGSRTVERMSATAPGFLLCLKECVHWPKRCKQETAQY